MAHRLGYTPDEARRLLRYWVGKNTISGWYLFPYDRPDFVPADEEEIDELSKGDLDWAHVVFDREGLDVALANFAEQTEGLAHPDPQQQAEAKLGRPPKRARDLLFGAAMLWLDHHGEPATQAELERYLHGVLVRVGETYAESLVRRLAKEACEAYRKVRREGLLEAG